MSQHSRNSITSFQLASLLQIFLSAFDMQLCSSCGRNFWTRRRLKKSVIFTKLFLPTIASDSVQIQDLTWKWLLQSSKLQFYQQTHKHSTTTHWEWKVRNDCSNQSAQHSGKSDGDRWHGCKKKNKITKISKNRGREIFLQDSQVFQTESLALS